MKNKHILTILLALVLLAAGCQKPAEPPPAPSPEAVQTPELTPTPTPTPPPAPEVSPGPLPEPEPTQYAELPPGAKELAQLPLPDERRLMRALELLTVAPRLLGSDNEKEAAEMIKTELDAMGYSLYIDEFDQNTFKAGPKICELEIDGASYKIEYISGPENDMRSCQLYYWDEMIPLPPSLSGKILVTPNELLARIVLAAVPEHPAYVMVLDYSEAQACPTLRPGSTDPEFLTAAARQGKNADITITAAVQQYVSCNIEAYDPADSGKPVLLVSAHYDSFYNSPGAVDNGCGVATLLEIARLYKGTRSDYDVRFIFFSGEEYDMIGSKAYAVKLTEEQRQNIRGVVNLDMFGSGKKPMYIATSDGKQNELVTAFLSSYGKYFDAAPQLKKLTNSDHNTFFKLGIPSFMICQDALEGVYHTGADTIAEIEPANLRTACLWVLAYLLNL